METRDIGGMWLLYGPERYVLHTFLMRLLALPGEAMREMNTVRLEAPTAEQIRAASDALPFFDDLRVVVCEETDADTAAAIAEHPECVPETTVLAFVHYGKLRADSAMLKAFKKADRDVLCDVRTPDSARRFIDTICRRCGVKMKDSAAQLLMDRRGTDLAQLESDIRMLSCVRTDGAALTPEDVARYIPAKTESKSWDLLGLFLAGRTGEAMRMYMKMLEDDPKCDFMILGYMEKRVAQELEVQALLRRGRQEKDIGEITCVKGYALTMLIKEARAADPATLRRALEALAKTDAAIKSGERAQKQALFAALAASFPQKEGQRTAKRTEARR